MTTGQTKWLQAVVLFTWAAVLGWFVASGRMTSYLHPVMIPGCVLASAVMFLLGLTTLLSPVDTHECGCGHTHDAPGPLAYASPILLVVTLLGAAWISPGHYGSSAVNNRGVVDSVAALPNHVSTPRSDTAQPASPERDFVPKTPEGAIKAQTVDLLYATAEPSLREDFENKTVEIVGQFMPARTANPAGDRFQLLRMFITCCAADARPIGITVQSMTPSHHDDMTWLKVVGKATFPFEGGHRVPLVIAESVSEVEAPNDPFIK